jgi:hypothetical protein
MPDAPYQHYNAGLVGVRALVAACFYLRGIAIWILYHNTYMVCTPAHALSGAH